MFFCLTYAASAWWDYASAADRQCLEAVLRRAKRTGLLAELVDRADNDLFEKVVSHPRRVLRNVLPDVTVPYYILRKRGVTIENF